MSSLDTTQHVHNYLIPVEFHVNVYIYTLVFRLCLPSLFHIIHTKKSAITINAIDKQDSMLMQVYDRIQENRILSRLEHIQLSFLEFQFDFQYFYYITLFFPQLPYKKIYMYTRLLVVY